MSGYSVSSFNSVIVPVFQNYFRKYFIFRVMYTDKFIIYKEAVVNAYHEKREKGSEAWMNQLTRYRVRRRCCELVENGVEKRDERTLHRYLEMDSNDNDYLRAIKETDGDDFQGFVKFLETPTINTSEDNVELLAWLISFSARPHAKFIEESLITPESESNDPVDPSDPVILVNTTPDIANPEETPPILVHQEKPPVDPAGRKVKEPEDHQSKFLKLLLIVLAIVVTGIMIWLFVIPKETCMYWNNDRYVATACGIPHGDTPLIALNQNKLKNFRKVKCSDTLSRSSIGHLWFTRVGDSLEFYTAEGKHPLYPDKRLKPLTDYAINFCRNSKNKVGGR